jgi:tetratricopeptide (TPR) repeat protein
MADVVLEQEPTPPRRANPALPNELGWIVLRAIARDPQRRYPTVAALLDDLARFRDNLPVVAGPPSTTYRLRKLVRRHRVGLTLLLVLVAGVGAGGYGLWRGALDARAGEERALAREQEARRGFLLTSETSRLFVRLFDGIRDTAASSDLRVHELLDRNPFVVGEETDPFVEAFVRGTRGEIYCRLQRFAEARAELERALARCEEVPPNELADAHGVALRLRTCLGRVLVGLGESERGEQMVRDALADAEGARSPRARLRASLALCRVLSLRNGNEELIRRATDTAEMARALGDALAETEADIMFVNAAAALDRHAEALPVAERAWRRTRETWGEHDSYAANALFGYVSTLQTSGRLDEAEQLYPQLLAVARAALGPDDPKVLVVLANQAALLVQRGQVDAAIDALRELVARYDATGAPVDQDHLIAINNLGQLLNQRGRCSEAEPFLARAAELTKELLDPRDPNGPAIRFNYGVCLAALKRWAEAEPILLAEFELLQRLLPAGHSTLGKFRRTIADGYEKSGQPQRAAEWRAQ